MIRVPEYVQKVLFTGMVPLLTRDVTMNCDECHDETIYPNNQYSKEHMANLSATLFFLGTPALFLLKECMQGYQR
jgi:hypothetical protein